MAAPSQSFPAVPLQVVQSTAAAGTLLNPDRLRLLEQLSNPDSASGLARKLKLPRQTVNYHLRELEKEGFVELVEQRAKGNCLERVVRATARSYVISPSVLGALGRDASEVGDRFSAAYLVSASARVIRDVSAVVQRASAAGKRVATLTMETDIRFASAGTRQQFTEELVDAVARLVEKYHDEKAPGGRRFRLLVGAYPAAANEQPSGPESIRME